MSNPSNLPTYSSLEFNQSPLIWDSISSSWPFVPQLGDSEEDQVRNSNSFSDSKSSLFSAPGGNDLLTPATFSSSIAQESRSLFAGPSAATLKAERERPKSIWNCRVFPDSLFSNSGTSSSVEELSMFDLDPQTLTQAQSRPALRLEPALPQSQPNNRDNQNQERSKLSTIGERDQVLALSERPQGQGLPARPGSFYSQAHADRMNHYLEPQNGLNRALPRAASSTDFSALLLARGNPTDATNEAAEAEAAAMQSLLESSRRKRDTSLTIESVLCNGNFNQPASSSIPQASECAHPGTNTYPWPYGNGNQLAWKRLEEEYSSLSTGPFSKAVPAKHNPWPETDLGVQACSGQEDQKRNFGPIARPDRSLLESPSPYGALDSRASSTSNSSGKYSLFDQGQGVANPHGQLFNLDLGEEDDELPFDIDGSGLGTSSKTATLKMSHLAHNGPLPLGAVTSEDLAENEMFNRMRQVFKAAGLSGPLHSSELENSAIFLGIQRSAQLHASGGLAYRGSQNASGLGPSGDSFEAPLVPKLSTSSTATILQSRANEADLALKAFFEHPFLNGNTYYADAASTPVQTSGPAASDSSRSCAFLPRPTAPDFVPRSLNRDTAPKRQAPSSTALPTLIVSGPQGQSVAAISTAKDLSARLKASPHVSPPALAGDNIINGVLVTHPQPGLDVQPAPPVPSEAAASVQAQVQPKGVPDLALMQYTLAAAALGQPMLGPPVALPMPLPPLPLAVPLVPAPPAANAAPTGAPLGIPPVAAPFTLPLCPLPPASQNLSQEELAAIYHMHLASLSNMPSMGTLLQTLNTFGPNALYQLLMQVNMKALNAFPLAPMPVPSVPAPLPVGAQPSSACPSGSEKPQSPSSSNQASQQKPLSKATAAPVSLISQLHGQNPELAAPQVGSKITGEKEKVPEREARNLTWKSAKVRTGPANELHVRLEECYQQFKLLEKERKKAEAELARQNPGKQISVIDPLASASSSSELSAAAVQLPRLPANPSRIDRLIVESFKEHVAVKCLLAKMEQLRAASCGGRGELPARIHSTMERWLEGIRKLFARRKEEINNTANRQRGSKSSSNVSSGSSASNERDLIALTTAIVELCEQAQSVRTALWCALQLTSKSGLVELMQHALLAFPCTAPPIRASAISSLSGLSGTPSSGLSLAQLLLPATSPSIGATSETLTLPASTTGPSCSSSSLASSSGPSMAKLLEMSPIARPLLTPAELMPRKDSCSPSIPESKRTAAGNRTRGIPSKR